MWLRYTVSGLEHFFIFFCGLICVQGGNNNYAELLFPQKKDLNPGQVERIHFSTPTPTAHSNISEHNPTSPLQNESVTLPTCPSARLYPSLETEMSSLNLQSTVIQHQQII